jgi:predicted nucleic acid-binding Zn ribbon protein
MELRNCLACNKPVKGRIDKKFCDDYCRNNYNNNKDVDGAPIIKMVNNYLKKNRKILQELLGDQDMAKHPKNRLLEKGFLLKYFTHQFMNAKGNAYIFCYEYGYLLLENEWILVVKREP